MRKDKPDLHRLTFPITGVYYRCIFLAGAIAQDQAIDWDQVEDLDFAPSLIHTCSISDLNEYRDELRLAIEKVTKKATGYEMWFKLYNVTLADMVEACHLLNHAYEYVEHLEGEFFPVEEE